MKYLIPFILTVILAGTVLASGDSPEEENQCTCECTCDEAVEDCTGDCCTCEEEDCSETGTCDRSCDNCTCTEEEPQETETAQPATSHCGGCPRGGCH